MLPSPPEAQQLANYMGWLLHGTWGGIVAGVFFVFPTIFCPINLVYIYAAYGSIPIIAGLFVGIKPVLVLIVMEAGLKIGKRGNPKFWLLFFLVPHLFCCFDST